MPYRAGNAFQASWRSPVLQKVSNLTRQSRALSVERITESYCPLRWRKSDESTRLFLNIVQLITLMNAWCNLIVRIHCFGFTWPQFLNSFETHVSSIKVFGHRPELVVQVCQMEKQMNWTCSGQQLGKQCTSCFHSLCFRYSLYLVI